MGVMKSQSGRRLWVQGMAAWLLAVSACTAFAAEKGKLLIWMNEDRGPNGYRQIAAEFTRKTGVPVEIEVMGDATGQFQTSAAAGQGPDIMIWAHDRIGEWVKLGLLRPVTPNTEVRSEVIGIGWDAFTIGRKIYGYPLAVEAIGLIYNKKHITTPPKSFEELPALDAQLKRKGVDAISWQYNVPYFTWPLMAADDAYPFYRDTALGWDVRDTGVAKPGAVAGLEVVLHLIDRKVLPEAGAYQDPEEAMKAGKVAMILAGPWAWEKLRQAKVDFGVAPLPTVKGHPARPFIGVQGAMVNAKSPNADLAVNFIENWLLKPEGLRKINADRPIGMPANKAYFRELYSDDVIRASMIENINAGKLMPSVPEMGKFWGALSSAIQEVTNRQAKPRDALKKAAKAIVGK